MEDAKRFPLLKSLHRATYLDKGKLAKMDKLSTEAICASLLAGEHCLKTRPDGTILEGHHRIYILRQRGGDVDVLPREEIKKDQE